MNNITLNIGEEYLRALDALLLCAENYRKLQEHMKLIPEEQQELYSKCDWLIRNIRWQIYNNNLDDEPDINSKLDNIYGELTALRTLLTQRQLDAWVKEMRDANPEERQSAEDYIKSISKETGVAFYE